MNAERHRWICVERSFSLGNASGAAIVVVAFVLLFSGCATVQSKSHPGQNSKRVRTLEKQLSRANQELEDLRERNLVLERQRAPAGSESVSVGSKPSRWITPQATVPMPVPVPFQPQREVEASLLPSSKITSESIPAARMPSILPLKTESVGSAQTGEHILYSKVLETYRKRNTAEMDQSIRLLLKTYPDSVFADNALYTAGLLSYELKDLGRAWAMMNRVVRDFPRGNKAVSALLARAAIEKKLGRFDSARSTLKKVKSAYPGSPEAARVSVEMKLIDLEAKKRRET